MQKKEWLRKESGTAEKKSVLHPELFSPSIVDIFLYLERNYIQSHLLTGFSFRKHSADIKSCNQYLMSSQKTRETFSLSNAPENLH